MYSVTGFPHHSISYIFNFSEVDTSSPAISFQAREVPEMQPESLQAEIPTGKERGTADHHGKTEPWKESVRKRRVGVSGPALGNSFQSPSRRTGFEGTLASPRIMVLVTTHGPWCSVHAPPQRRDPRQMAIFIHQGFQGQRLVLLLLKNSYYSQVLSQDWESTRQ